MTDVFSFRWEGADNPNDPSGVALFTVGSESVLIVFNDFSQAEKLRGLIEKACERSKHRVIERATFSIATLFKEHLRD